MGKRRSVLEAQITAQQRKAADLMAENEWAGIVEGVEKKTMQQIAEEVGVSRRTLYEWKDKEEFGEYLNYISDIQFSAMRPVANASVMRLIKAGSVKALDLFYRRHSLLTNVTEIKDSRESDAPKRKTDDEIRQDIADLDAMMNG
ncbi:phBC6A51 family helix-turn-helix protein [Paenibacillus qinlingensis]|uniref:phBC6A51 family helix-turn-helix protein n=1 Tax=Paenibacillus qinlingensis TaxID=1837343 RepID=UPI001565490B|nr:phBC6A51 family helix-turn-helix protein [Paenibacillus qinlingensis]NQX61813.1 helix-turn-helix domain-containing protein [Paenibacillus qinlingensis]